MAAPTGGTTAPPTNPKYFCILSMFIGLLLPVSANSYIPKLTLKDIDQIVADACVLAALEPVSPELSPTLEQLSKNFLEDAHVVVAHLQLTAYEEIRWKTKGAQQKASNSDLAFFPKKILDRKCLLKPAHTYYGPEAEQYAGEPNLSSLVGFINHRCVTFREENGALSRAGLHRQFILNNLFHTKQVTNMTMGRLYRTMNNPLNQSFSFHDDCSVNAEITNDKTCFTSTNKAKSKYSKGMEPKTEMAKCERLKTLPDKEEFFHKYLKLSRPVIFEKAIVDWPAVSKWTTEFLRDQYGEREVHIKLTPGGDYEGVEKAELWDNYDTFNIPAQVREQLKFPDLVVVRPATLNIKFTKFLDLVEYAAQQKEKNISAYLEYSSIPEYMPELEDDIQPFDFVKGLLTRRHFNIWLSDGNTLGRLHFDPFDNLLCQISGMKQVVMFEPYDNTRLYEAHIPQAMLHYDADKQKFQRKELSDSTSMVMSPVDTLNPDFKRFPKFADVHPLNCTLEEGDVLFMPSFWWHEVQSFPNTQQRRNLAVNLWYEPFLTKEFPCQECRLDVNPHYHHLL